MSEATHYMLASAGINVTEEEIAAIEATGYPYEVCNLLAHYARQDQAKKAASQHATEALRHRLDANWREHER